MLEPRPCAHGPCTLPARSAQAHLHHRFDSNVNWLAVAVQARRSALAPYPSARCASVPVPTRCVATHLTFLRAVWPRAQFTYTSLFGAYSSYLFLRTGLIVAPLAACAGGQESPPPPMP